VDRKEERASAPSALLFSLSVHCTRHTQEQRCRTFPPSRYHCSQSSEPFSVIIKLKLTVLASFLPFLPSARSRSHRGEVHCSHRSRDSRRPLVPQQSRYHSSRRQRFVRKPSLLLELELEVEVHLLPFLVAGANVLLTSAPRIVLCDFGVSAPLFLSSSNTSKRTTFVGTPYWMAPEVLLGRPYDTKADIWGLGITILEIADKDGEPPHAKEDAMRVIMMIPKMKPPKLPENENWSREMREFLAGCLNEQPDEVSDLPFLPQVYVSGEWVLTRLPTLWFSAATFGGRPSQDEVDQVRREASPHAS